MKRTDFVRQGAYVFGTLLALLCGAAAPAVAQEVLSTDLSPLIDQSAPLPTRFAVDVPHPVSLTSRGTWTENGTRSTWTYSIRIPAAVSMSFHASALSLPGDAVLTVTGKNAGSVSYKARDIVRGGLWSRLFAGDSLRLSLVVNTTERSAVALQIASFQAGYRSLGGTVQDNAHYLSLKLKAQQTSSCTLNYSCQATSANQGPANATVAIVVGNVDECTGTLLNDTSADGIAYVLTARHCENGQLGGGNPAAAATVTIYWDAVTPCGTALGTIYDTGALTQSGATTMVEQQDAWLIKLDALPVANDAFYSGWDATGGVFSGGYSIHHALGFDKQYVSWYGQPILQTIPGATLSVGYSSTFWGLVNETGNVGAGSSGGALFDPDNNLVGSGTLAHLVNGEGSAGVCPATPPPAPTPSTVTAYYTTLSTVWNSTADTTSTTGASTLKSVLDAADTGHLVVGGLASVGGGSGGSSGGTGGTGGTGGSSTLSVTLTADKSDPGTNQIVNLTWNAPGAQSCTAVGGWTGDGWAGPRPTSGTYAINEQSAGGVVYGISCTASGQIATAEASVNWQYLPIGVSLTGSGPTAVAGRMVLLQWTSYDTLSCTASGGTPGDGWAGPKALTGSQSVQASVLGTVTYAMTCVNGLSTRSTQYSLTVVAPTAGPIISDANQMLPGQTVNLQFTGGGACVASGGGSGDGWAGPLSTSTDSGVLSYTIPVTETAVGTYIYTVTCSGAGATANLSSTNSTTLTFAGTQPTASLSANPIPVEIYTDPGVTTHLNLAWTSNVRPCGVTYAGPGGQAGTVLGVDMSAPTGTGADDQEVAGSYVYTLTCGTGQNQAQSTAIVLWFTTTPTVTLNVDTQWPQNSPATIHWQSNVYPCTGTAGMPGDGWVGAKTKAMGYQAVTESTLGAVTFGITCGTGSQVAQAQANTTVITPIVSITASANSLPVDSPLIINWNANIGPCSSSISPGNGNFGTALSNSGGFQTTEFVAITNTYTINCAGVQASTQVTFTGSLTTLTASASSVTVSTPITLSWSAPSYSTSCTASGGSPGDGWAGNIGNEGTRNITSATAATVTYSIDCNFGYGPSQAQTQVTYTPLAASEPTVPVPAATLTASTASTTTGSPVTLSWTSENASACSAMGGENGDGWTGALSLAGSMSLTESGVGTVSYGIVCTGAPPAAGAYTNVSFTAPTVTVTGTPPGSSSSSSTTAGKSGGGGMVDPLAVSLLGLLVVSRVRQLPAAPKRNRKSSSASV